MRSASVVKIFSETLYVDIVAEVGAKLTLEMDADQIT
jgi:hypothetical protein